MSSQMKAQLVCLDHDHDYLATSAKSRLDPSPRIGVHSMPARHSGNGSTPTGFKASMSRRGNGWDNAVFEICFGSLKQERVQWCSYQRRDEAQQDVMNDIAMFYNQSWWHSYLGDICPNNFERQMVNMKNVA